MISWIAQCSGFFLSFNVPTNWRDRCVLYVFASSVWNKSMQIRTWFLNKNLYKGAKNFLTFFSSKQSNCDFYLPYHESLKNWSKENDFLKINGYFLSSNNLKFTILSCFLNWIIVKVKVQINFLINSWF